MSTRSVVTWMLAHIPISTVTTAVDAIAGTGLQHVVWCNLSEHGPTTVHELAGRLGEDHQRVRNALYRLICARAVRCLQRVPSPIGASRPRVVWAAIDRDGRVLTGKQRAE